MENTQHGKTANVSGKKAVISDASTKSKLVAGMVKQGSGSLSSAATTATTQNALPKTWKSAELEELKRKIGLVAGALSDFQTAGGLVVVKQIEYAPEKFAVKLYLTASGISVKANQTVDGLDFDLVAHDND